MNTHVRRAAWALMVIVLLTACAGPTRQPTAASVIASPGPAATSRPPLVPHPLAEFADCTACHNPRSSVPIPANHALYTRADCLRCHWLTFTPAPDVTPTPQPLPHSVAGRETCSLCHTGGRLDLPADHREYRDEKCLECHTEPAVSPAPGPTPAGR